MINPFANTKKKGKKGPKTPKNSGLKKKEEATNSDNDVYGPETFDRRTDNTNLIRIDALNNHRITVKNSLDSEHVVHGINFSAGKMIKESSSRVPPNIFDPLIDQQCE
jgi:hypothetical protein